MANICVFRLLLYTNSVTANTILTTLNGQLFAMLQHLVHLLTHWQPGNNDNYFCSTDTYIQ